MEQEIITFYEDETKQKALFPTTTSNAVKWDETQSLPQKMADVESQLGLQMELVWQNANTIAEFPAQKINVDLSGAKMVGFRFKSYTTATIKDGQITFIPFGVANTGISQGSIILGRDIRSFIRLINNIDSSGVDFGNAYGEGGNEPNVMVPVEIYKIM